MPFLGGWGIPLLFGIGGALLGSSAGKKKEPKIVTEPALHPEQEKMIPGLEEYISDNLGKPLEQYGGSYVAPTTQQQKNAMSNLENLAWNFVPQTGDLENLTWNFAPQITQNSQAASDALIRALNTDAGMKEAEDYYQQSIHNPALQSFQKEVLPGIQKAYAGPGTYWGSERAGAVRDASTDLAGQLAGIRAQTMFDARNTLENRALQAAGQIHQNEQFMQSLGLSAEQARTGFGLDKSRSLFDMGLSAEQARTGFGLDKSSRLFDMGEAIRQADQLGLDRQYSEWLRTRPENSPYLQAALNFMGLPTTATHVIPGQRGIGSDLISITPEILAVLLQAGVL